MAAPDRAADETTPLIDAAPVRSPREVLRRFWPNARPYRGWILLCILLSSVLPLVEAATIWLYGRLIDDVLVPRDLAPLPSIAGLYLALTLVGGILAFGKEYATAWTGERLLLDLRLRLFRHLLALPPAFFHKTRLGDLLARLTEDVDEIEAILVSGAASAVSSLLKLVFFGGALFLIDWRLALVALVVAPPCWYAARRFAAKVKGISREQRQWEGAVASVAEEILANATLVQAHNRQGWEASRFEREARGDLVSQLSLEKVRAAFSPLVGLLELAGVLVVVAVGAMELARGAITLGDLLIFLAYLSQLYGPVRTLTHLAGDVATATASGERVIEVLDAPSAATATASGKRPDEVQGRIEVEGVGYRYPGAAAPALAGVSFAVRAGRIGRARRPQRRRQVDARLPAAALRRPRRGAGQPRRRRPPRPGPPRPAGGDRRRAARDDALRRHRPRQHRLRPHRSQRRGGRRRRPRRRRHGFIAPSRTATRRGSASAGGRCPAASGSGSRSPAPCSAMPRS
jgi:ABC-type multidrug transport system fused ATPase/permease subunit